MLAMHTKTTHKACNYIMTVYTLTRPFSLCLEVCSNHAQDLFHTHAHFIHCDYLYQLRKWQTEIIIMVPSFHPSLPTHTHTQVKICVSGHSVLHYFGALIAEHSSTFSQNFGPVCFQLKTLLETRHVSIKEST